LNHLGLTILFVLFVLYGCDYISLSIVVSFLLYFFDTLS